MKKVANKGTEYSPDLKKTVKILAILFGGFVVAIKLGETTMIIYGLLLLLALALFAVWGVVMFLLYLVGSFMSIIKELARTRYVIVFKF
jgi:ABC-type multidrug transport system fused ATPase/permease subunit